MRVAPIQVGPIFFRRLSVELDEKHLPKAPPADSPPLPDFENVAIATHVSVAPLEHGSEPGHHFLLFLRVQVENKQADDPATRYSPYRVDIESGAAVKALSGAEVLGDLQDIVAVNGTGLLWSAIREQVSTLTARMPAGPVTLPTVNFRDLRKQTTTATPKVPVPKPRKSKAATAKSK